MARGSWWRDDPGADLVRTATDRRLAGDWRGACDAAGMEVDPSVAAADLPGLADDLRHLVPDLVRWHLFDADLRVTAATPVVLSRFVAADGRHRSVVVTTPSVVYDTPRLVLAVEPSAARPGRHLSRCYWDIRHADRLRAHLGGSDRTPFFHRDGQPLREAELPGADPPVGDRAALTEWECRLPSDRSWPHRQWRTAWRAAGVDIGPGVDDALASGHYEVARWSYLVPAARDLLVAETGRPEGTVHFPWEVEWPYEYLRLALTLRPDAEPLLHVAESVTSFTQSGGGSRYVCERPVLPAMAQRDPWFVAPLRAGVLTPAALHPLVRGALFPDRPDEP